MEQAPAPEPAPIKSTYASVFSILLIVLVLVAGAFYVWNKRLSEQRPQQATYETSAGAEIIIPE